MMTDNILSEANKEYLVEGGHVFIGDDIDMSKNAKGDYIANIDDIELILISGIPQAFMRYDLYLEQKVEMKELRSLEKYGFYVMEGNA